MTSPPLPPDVEVTVVDGRLPAVFLRSRSAQPVRVYDATGLVFLEVRPDRVVANPRSLVHVEDQRGKGRLPPLAPAGDGFLLVASAPSYSWLDPRLRYTEPAVPSAVQRRTSSTTLVRWSIPLEVAGRRFEVAGTTGFVPFPRGRAAPGDGGSRWPRALLIGAIPVAALLTLGALRRRATYDPGRPEE